jgi:hypothetical protein
MLSIAFSDISSTPHQPEGAARPLAARARRRNNLKKDGFDVSVVQNPNHFG